MSTKTFESLNKEKDFFESVLEEKKSKVLENSIKKLINLEGEKPEDLINFLYNSVYSNNLIINFNLNEKKKEKLVSIARIVQYFLDFKLRWPATISSAESVVKYVKNFCAPDRETFIAIYLDSHNNVLSTSIISYGTIDFAYVNVKMIFSYALKYQASKIIVVHNHPTGDPTPSNEDINFTEKVSSISKDFGITLLDHIIIANTYYSFKGEGLL